MDAEAVVRVDAILWSIVVPLFLAALWLSRPTPRAWSPVAMFHACGAILGGGAVGDAMLLPASRIGLSCTPEALRGWFSRLVHEGRSGGPVDDALARRGATVLYWGRRKLDLPAPTGWAGVDLGDAITPDAEATLEALLAVPGARFVVVVTEGAERFLPFFAEVPGLRDHTRAVVLAGADLRPSAPWLKTVFKHETLDLELDRQLPWFTLRDGPDQALPQPDPDPTGRQSIEVLDLGEADARNPAVAASLLLVLAALA